MKSLVKITLLEPLTQEKIDNLISSEDLVVVQVERAYPCGDVPEMLSLTLPAQVGETFLSSLKDVIDEASFVHEQEAFIFAAKYSDGIIDLSESYVRSQKDTDYSRPMIPGKGFGIVFSVSGFSGVQRVSGILNFGSSFPGGLRDDLAEIGIVIDNSSTTENIIITSAHCGGFMVGFYVPEGETGNYIFDNDFKGKVLSL